ncbi:MAG: cation-transporting ATPase [Cyclobacteriaceae bacterium]|nr:cation-transporting ATPase [Cyclobacteriaceae bacterium]
MKYFLKTIALMLVFSTISIVSNAQDVSDNTITTEFKVSGLCNMCKERIENAALIKGVKFAEWNKETKMLMVVYKPGKTNELAIQKAIAEHGHDTEKVKATKEAYDKLPMCCEYRRSDAEDH